jgi:DNA modification methylase
MSAESRARLSIEWRLISTLKLNRRNPRSHSERQIRQLADSIDTFDFVVPVLIDRNGGVLAGHGRVLACQKLGRTEVPVICLDHLTEAQAKALTLADNRLAEMSCWNDRLLAETLKELSEINLDFSIETTGFTMGEIDLRIEGLSATIGDGADPADQLPAPTGQLATSKLGDHWHLGRHALLCGSALCAESFHTLLGDKRAHMVFTDPPFNVRIHGHASGKGRIQHREFEMAAGEMDVQEFTSFLTRSCSLAAKHSFEGSLHLVCMDWRHAGELLEAGRLSYTELKNICVWVKDNAGMGSFYRSQHELVFVFKHGSKSHRNNIQLGRYGRNRTNVWHYPCANTFSRQSEEGYLAACHPTVKPAAMVADAILDCTARGEVVMDPFLGSGTTIIAAERVGRCCYGIEIDPLYVDTIIRRWQAFTGDKAIHAVTAKSFDDLAVETEANRG